MALADYRLRFRGLSALYILYGAYAVLAGVVAILLNQPAVGLVGAVFGLLAIIGLIGAVSLLARIRTAARSLYTPGAEFSAEYGAAAVVLRSPGRISRVPYAAVPVVRRNRSAVLFAIPTQPSYLVPIELCPPEALAVVEAGRRSGASPAPGIDGFTASADPSPAFLRAVRRRVTRRALAEPALWCTIGVFVLLVPLIAILASLPWWLTGVLAVAAIALMAGALALALPAASRRIRASFDGPLLASFDADGFALLDRGVYTRRDYATVTRFQELGDAVELVSTASVDPELLPTALFPPDALARLDRAGVS